MRYGQISFFNVLDPKIALPDWNSRQYFKTVGFVSKLYKTCFSGNAQHVLATSHFWASKFSKSSRGSEILARKLRLPWKLYWTLRFPWKLYKTLFSGHAQHVLAKSHFWASKFSKSWNWLKISSKRKKSALFRSCAFLQNRKRVRIFERQSP